MHPTDRAIFEHCLNEFRPVSPLKGPIPSGRLYRHVSRLVKVGWLEKQGALYRTTEAGHRQLAGATSGTLWDDLAEVYPPLTLVPTPVHRALIELILAAIAARQHEIRPDRHPFFAVFGSTLRWKTSLGRFVCHAVGLDPAVQVVDCSSEAGKSLSFRRGSDGALVSKRALLETPFLVLDEFQLADRRVLSTLGIFLGGRLVMPLENEQLTIRPVSLLTLNPKDAPTLEGRLGLSAPLIRRALLANFDAVAMPDLAAVGERAVEAARAHPPLVLAAPPDDLQGSHDTIVNLVRGVLLPAAHECIDVEIVANLSAGMTAFIPEPGLAIAQVIHGIGCLAETLGWARPGWIEVVSDFRRGPKNSAAATSALARVVPAETQTADAVKERGVQTAISLSVPPARPRRRTSVPELDLSDELRARLIWFAMETQHDVEVALTTLLDFYLEWREADATIEALAAILRLGAELERAEVDVKTLHDYVKTLKDLRKNGCDFEDVPEALHLITLLQTLPVAWDWKQAKTTIEAVAVILETGIPLEDVTEFLERHRRLETLGFDEATAAAVAEALTRAGAVGDRRGAVLDQLVGVARREVDVQALDEQREELQAEVAKLKTHMRNEAMRLEDLRTETQILQQDVAQLQETKTRLVEECQRQAGGLAVVRALRAFLLGKTKEAEALWVTLKGLLAWRQAGGSVDDSFGTWLTRDVREQIVAFFQQLLQEMAPPK
jgi:hypothetical protein